MDNLKIYIHCQLYFDNFSDCSYYDDELNVVEVIDNIDTINDIINDKNNEINNYGNFISWNNNLKKYISYSCKERLKIKQVELIHINNLKKIKDLDIDINTNNLIDYDKIYDEEKHDNSNLIDDEEIIEQSPNCDDLKIYIHCDLDPDRIIDRAFNYDGILNVVEVIYDIEIINDIINDKINDIDKYGNFLTWNNNLIEYMRNYYCKKNLQISKVELVYFYDIKKIKDLDINTNNLIDNKETHDNSNLMDDEETHDNSNLMNDEETHDNFNYVKKYENNSLDNLDYYSEIKRRRLN